jgi:putative ABC transport system ATP-binding protein
MARRAIIRTQGLSKAYQQGSKTIEALREVDLTVWQGEWVGITGRSGSGKSTLLNILGCLDKPSLGRYYLGDTDVSRLPDQSLSRIRAEQIGFVFQNYNLVPGYSILENVAMPYMYRSDASGQAERLALQALELVGLADRVQHRPNQLSGGEMQRAAIARAIAGNPLLLLADEPTGNLDSATTKGILDIFRRLQARGATIVLVTHDQAVAQYCERVLNLADGRLSAQGGAS